MQVMEAQSSRSPDWRVKWVGIRGHWPNGNTGADVKGLNPAKRSGPYAPLASEEL